LQKSSSNICIYEYIIEILVNAYGLANTLKQTDILKPRIHHKKISNLYYTGQLTSPGPGMPPSIISGQVVAGLINREV
jgi:phytoene desaturase